MKPSSGGILEKAWFFHLIVQTYTFLATFIGIFHY